MVFLTAEIQPEILFLILTIAQVIMSIFLSVYWTHFNTQTLDNFF